MNAPGPCVSLVQPAFLPWQGLFGLIAKADEVVFLDDFQFSRQSWQQRNRLFVGPELVGWITVPVDRHQGRTGWPTLLEARPLLDGFRRRFISTLTQTYGRTGFRAPILDAVTAWISNDWPSLAGLNIAFIQFVAEALQIRPRFHRSSEIGHSGKRSAAVLDLLRRTGAKTYLSARGSFSYMRDDGVFPVEGIAVRFQSYEPEPYPQRHSPSFVPYLSVVDGLLQVGPEMTREVIERSQRPSLRWVEMDREHTRSQPEVRPGKP